MASQEHILIIGAGIFGASTAYHLTSPSRELIPQASALSLHSKVTLLDRSPLGSGIGASEDINKIIRSDYSSKCYMDLGYEAIEAWKSLSRPGGIFEGLYHQTGWLVLDDGEDDFYDQIRKLYREKGSDPTEDVDLRRIKELYPEILGDANLTGFRNAYSNTEAGWADAGAAVKTMIEEAVKSGVEYKVGEAVAFVLGDKNLLKGVRLANGDVIEADKVILATGAWSSSLMSGIEEELSLLDGERLERQLTAAGVCVAHYKLTKEEEKLYSKIPVLVYGGNGEVLPPTDDGILKFTYSGSITSRTLLSSGKTISIPKPKDQRIVPRELKNEIARIVHSIMPQLQANGREVDYWRMCWDSITPTQDQLICQHPHPSLHNLYLAVGGSFHSYKFLPIIGKYVANVIRGSSNGEEKDRAWAWKTGITGIGRGAHANVVPERDMKDLTL